jgi:hypothetical protein
MEQDKRLKKDPPRRVRMWIVEDRRPGHEYELCVTLAKQPNDTPSILKLIP